MRDVSRDFSSRLESNLLTPPRDDRGLILLSAPQLEIWLDQKINPSSHPYNFVEYIEINGPVDPQLFERALRQVVSETEALRVQITEYAGEPRQVVGATCAWSLPFFDLSAEIDARASAEAWMKADLKRAIDLIARAVVSIRLVQGIAHSILLVRALPSRGHGRFWQLARGPPSREHLHAAMH